MNKHKVLILIVCGIMLLLGVYKYLSKLYLPPIFEDKVVIDIWNDTDKLVSDISIFCDESDQVTRLPDILPKERIIVTLKPNNINVPKTKLYVNYNDENRLLVAELRKNVGTEAIITINKEGFETMDLSYKWNRYKYKLYYKKYSRIVELN